MVGLLGACDCTMVMASNEWWNIDEAIRCGDQLFADFDPAYINLLFMLNRLVIDAVHMHPIARTIISSHEGKVKFHGQASCLATLLSNPLRFPGHEALLMPKEKCRACLEYCREKLLNKCGKSRVGVVETNGCYLSYSYNIDGQEGSEEACPAGP